MKKQVQEFYATPDVLERAKPQGRPTAIDLADMALQTLHDEDGHQNPVRRNVDRALARDTIKRSLEQG